MISEAQRNVIKGLLELQGLTFKPLKEEMIDHICCDVEDRMTQGISFDEALRSALHEIPEDHFRTIQKNVMNTINKQFAWSQWLSYAALGMLLGSVVFKMLHLQFGGVLLFLSFGLMAASLLISSASGIYMNREKRGALRVMGVIIGVIALLISYSFRILHLSGADQLVLLAVIIIVCSLLANTLFVYRNATGEGNLLTYLHEKYTPGIERFLLFLLVPVTLYKIISVVTDPNNFVGGLILLVVIFGAGLQLIARSWRSIEEDAAHRTPYILIALIISSMCLVLVFLGQLIPFEIRVIMIALYSCISGWLAFRIGQAETTPSLLIACLVPVIFCSWAMVRLGIIPIEANRFIFNLPVLVLLMIGLFLCRKNELMRTYMIISISSYVFEYVY